MNVNANSRFSQVPQVANQRSRFEIPHSHKTTFNVGELIPFYYEEVLPGDTFNVETNLIARMQPLVAPIMDDIYLDTYYFFVPNRLVWRHWKEFMGENTEGAWYPTTEYNVPHCFCMNASKAPKPYSLADYFGYPVSLGDNHNLAYTASQLPFRAYALIWNEWFRDENIQDPVLVDLGDNDVQFRDDTTYGGQVLKANKYHDYFTSALPDSQKGPDVFLPLNDYAPVFPLEQRYDVTGYTTPYHLTGWDPSFDAQSKYPYISETGLFKAAGSSSWPYNQDYGYVMFDNMYADLSQASATSVNALRLALATQSFYEKNARGGTRYRELVKSHFGVTSPDGRMQVPELLNYNRINININQVVANIAYGAMDRVTPAASQSAYALTADSDNSFMKSFTEHGMVIGLCCARYKHTYQNGLDRRYSRRTMFDYYFPVFANLGEQPIFNQEIYTSDSLKTNNEIFGYQEAFAEYRYHPDIVTGEMRSEVPNSLDVWHLADMYYETPALSPEWIQEDKTNVDRCLAIDSWNANQLFADFYIKNTAVRVMPMFSIPGLPRTL